MRSSMQDVIGVGHEMDEPDDIGVEDPLEGFVEDGDDGINGSADMDHVVISD
jgi:hypothetical protein